MTPRHLSCTHKGYALTCDEYDELRSQADGRCQMCHTATETLCIDHDHNMGQWAVRGLLCHGCNQYLGRAEASAAPIVGAVAAYLATPWHASSPASSQKAARARRRGNCPTCGHGVSFTRNGSPTRHYSRLPGRWDDICTPGPDAH